MTLAFWEGDVNAWFLLVIAALFEVARAIGLKYTDGFFRFWPTVGTVSAISISLWLLGLAINSLPVGTVVLGNIVLGVTANVVRFISMALILIGIVGLELSKQG